ncbi:MAG: TetR/AcrR family transcriptional regulator [Bacteroidales bacterium]|nr:TetR/AcrR family transcriptional regulator [Bacteroidales bacterium]MCF8455891.1 TetR/AcrR family transcriptional regulator [Bacteroidales bacterium]
MTTEERIFNAAREIFLVYGFHATSMQRIADEANVNKAATFYYFRSKEKLYQQIVHEVAEKILFNGILDVEEENTDTLFFIIIELRNNKPMLMKSLNSFAEIDWCSKINKLGSLTLG